MKITNTYSKEITVHISSGYYFPQSSLHLHWLF